MTWPSGDQYVGDWVNNQRCVMPLAQNNFNTINTNVEENHHNKERNPGQGTVFICTAVATDTRASIWLGKRFSYILIYQIILFFVVPSSLCPGKRCTYHHPLLLSFIVFISRRVLVSFGGQLDDTREKSLSDSSLLKRGKK